MPRTAVVPPPLPQPAALVPPIYARLLRMLLQHADVDADRVLASAGLDWPTLLRDDRRLGRDTIVALAEGAMAATRRPWLGLDLGAAPVSAHGALGYAVVSSPDLRAALETIARYGATRNDALSWRCVDTPCGMTMRATERAELGGPVRGFVIDTVLAALLRMLESALGQLPPSLRVDLPLPAPPWREQYGRFGLAEIRFEQPEFALHLARADLALPCLGADARAHANACRECEEALAEVAGASLAQRVAGLLAGVDVRRGGGYPRMAEVARRCGISPRTLIRRLGADGTSWQALLDTARKQRALWLLQHTGEAVEEIAARLGYQDTSNFSRTVRRWFGATPRALRDRADAA